MGFKENLRKTVAKKGGQIRFAKSAGVTQASISHYSTGKRYPRQDILSKLAGAAGCTIDDLKAGDEGLDGQAVGQESEVQEPAESKKPNQPATKLTGSPTYKKAQALANKITALSETDSADVIEIALVLIKQSRRRNRGRKAVS